MKPQARILFALSCLLTSLPALAAEAGQGDRPPPPPGAPGHEMRRFIDVRAGGPGALAGAGLRMNGKLVKNLPYSAEVISERQRNLADGNQIVNKNSSYTYRDSAGRTRQEVRDDKGEIRVVTIHDPVAGVTWLLNPKNKVANKITPPPHLGAAAGEAARARIEQLRKEGKLPEGRHEIVIRRSEDGGDSVRVEASGPIMIEADSATMRGGNPRELMLGPIGGAFTDMKWAAKATTRELGSKDIDGVRAEGKLRSYEIPAGEVGNRNAIVVSDETWFAPELQITVLSKHSDPRSGDNVYRLAALKREEPAASLFAVPADYTVKDVMANVRGMMEKKGEAPPR